MRSGCTQSKGVICLRVVVHCKDLGVDDIKYLEGLVKEYPSARVRVTTDGGLTTLIATGIYDELVKVIVAVTIVKNFEAHLQ